MTKTLPEILVMLKTAVVEIKKDHAVLMVNKTVDFKKSGGRAKGKNGRRRRMASRPPPHPGRPNLAPSQALSASIAKRKAIGSATAPST